MGIGRSGGLHGRYSSRYWPMDSALEANICTPETQLGRRRVISCRILDARREQKMEKIGVPVPQRT